MDKEDMKRKKGLINPDTNPLWLREVAFILLVLMLVAVFSIGAWLPAIASDVDDAEYTGTIRISNNSTPANGVAVNCTISTEQLINGGYINSSCNNTAIRNMSAADVTYMPANTGNSTWIIWVPSIPQETSHDYPLYTGGTTDMAGKIRYFPGPAGMSVADNSSLEISNNGSIVINGYIDTTAVGANITHKPNAFMTYINASGNITSRIARLPIDPIANDDFELNSDWTTGAGTANQSSDQARSGTYSWKVTDNQGYAYQDIDWSDDYRGANVTYKCWGHQASGNFHLSLDDGVSTNSSGQVSTTGSWAPVSVSIQIASNATQLRLIMKRINAGSVYFDDAELTSDEATVMATGISSGEHTVKTSKNSAFLSIGIDIGDGTAFPSASDNIVLNAPMWQTSLDGGTFDSIDAYAHTSTVSGATWSSAGRVFDGDDDNIDCGTTSLFDFTSENFTLGIWIRPSVVDGGADMLFDRHTWVTSGWRFGLFNNALYFYTLQGGANQLTTSGSVLTVDTWQYIVLARSGTSAIIYVNGVDETSSSGTHTDPATHNGTLYIGATAGTQEEFTGTIGEFAIHNIAFSPAEILANYNATKWKYIGSDTADVLQYVYSDVSVPNSSSNWTFCEAGAMPYVSSVNISIGGTLQGSWAWENGTTFSDLSGNSHTATPTFRTTSSDADVSAVFLSFTPISQTQADEYALGAAGTMVSTPGAISEWTAELTNIKLPGADFINDLATAGGVPKALIWFPMVFAQIILAGFLAYFISKSLLVESIAMGLAIGFFSLTGVFGLWVLPIFAIEATAIIVMSKQLGW